MGGRAFVDTQSVKKLSGHMKKAVFNDYGYKLLSSDTPVTIEDLKSFDKLDPENIVKNPGMSSTISTHAHAISCMGKYYKPP